MPLPPKVLQSPTPLGLPSAHFEHGVPLIKHVFYNLLLASINNRTRSPGRRKSLRQETGGSCDLESIQGLGAGGYERSSVYHNTHR